MFIPGLGSSSALPRLHGCWSSLISLVIVVKGSKEPGPQEGVAWAKADDVRSKVARWAALLGRGAKVSHW